MAHAPLYLPADPLHMRLFNDTEGDLAYQEYYDYHLFGQQWTVSSPGIILGPEGVAAPIKLTPKELANYKMRPSSQPHISLAFTRGSQAKALGPMIAKANLITKREPTEVEGVSASPSAPSFTLFKERVFVQFVLTREQLQHHHGAEYSNDPLTEAALVDIDDSLWVTHQRDMGKLNVKPVSFAIDLSQPVNIPQYPIKMEARDGIKDTIEGLLVAKVIHKTVSSGNTPILLVLNADGKSYRMAHDLRAINSFLKEDPLMVPNPAAALDNLRPEHQWFTVIDLASAFFCLPLTNKLQKIFAFTYEGTRYAYTRMPQWFSLTPGIFNAILKSQLQLSPPLPRDVLLIQHVDDLLIAAPTSSEASMNLLHFLAEIGFKIQKDKMQLVPHRVMFLGSLITSEGKELTPTQRKIIFQHKKQSLLQTYSLFWVSLTTLDNIYLTFHTTHNLLDTP